MAKIIVVHGPAGSGKSTQCNRLAHEGLDGTTQHISAGNRLRAIRANLVTSEFSDYINDPHATTPLPDEIIGGAIFELMRKAEENDLVLIDGYPRQPQSVDSFRSIIQTNNHKLLGTVAMKISLDTSIERIKNRGLRDGEQIVDYDLRQFALRRYELEKHTTDLAIERLGDIAPVEIVEADDDTDIVYMRFRLALGRLAL